MSELLHKEYYRLTVLCVPCPTCGAQVGKRCRGTHGRDLEDNWHVMRKAAMHRFRQEHPEEYARRRQQMIEERGRP